MPTQWFVRQGDKVFGPLEPAKLKSLATSGKINEATEVAPQGDGPWAKAGTIRGLFAPSPPAATPSDSRPPPPPPMPALPGESAAAAARTKPWFRRWYAMFVLYPFLALMGCGVVIQMVVPKETLERWNAEAAERREKRAAEKSATSGSNGSKGKETPPGFTMGFMTGAMAARDGARKPSNDDVDAIARRMATQNEVIDKQRSAWISNFKTAFWMGWRKGQ